MPGGCQASVCSGRQKSGCGCPPSLARRQMSRNGTLGHFICRRRRQDSTWSAAWYKNNKHTDESIVRICTVLFIFFFTWQVQKGDTGKEMKKYRAAAAARYFFISFPVSPFCTCQVKKKIKSTVQIRTMLSSVCLLFLYHAADQVLSCLRLLHIKCPKVPFLLIWRLAKLGGQPQPDFCLPLQTEAWHPPGNIGIPY